MTQAVSTVKEAYEYLLSNWTDMQSHIPTLREYAKGNCMEIGVRGGASTAALLMGLEEKGGHLWSFDINDCPVFHGHPLWTFTQADTQTEQEKILSIVPEKLDVLFVDGDHSYEGALNDLEKFGHRAKVILIHDVDCPDTFPGVRRAMEEYAAKIGVSHRTMAGSYGLGIIERTHDISRALAISGWMTSGELVWLADQAALHATVVEIGSYQGRSTRAMGDNAKGIVYAVDDWKGLRTVDEIWWTTDTPKNIRESLFEIFSENLKDLIASGKVIPVRTDHASVDTPSFPAVDMVFIDGGHDNASVKRDIQKWLPVLKSGGLMCGHDANQYEVMQAVNECLQGAKSGEVGLIWSWEKP